MECLAAAPGIGHVALALEGLEWGPHATLHGLEPPPSIPLHGNASCKWVRHEMNLGTPSHQM